MMLKLEIFSNQKGAPLSSRVNGSKWTAATIGKKTPRATSAVNAVKKKITPVKQRKRRFSGESSLQLSVGYQKAGAT
jgi:hypothetical protein